MFDHIIVGKGLFGTAAARHLSAMAGNVAIIGPDEPEDPSRHEGVFASHYDQGRIQRRLSRNVVWSILAHRSYLEYEHLQAESGVRFYHPVDGVHLVPGSKESIFVEAAAEIATRLGIDCTVTSGRDVVARWPVLGFPDDCYGFIEHFPAGYINPRELIRAQLAVAARRGATIVRDTVVEIRRGGDLVTVVTGSGHTCKGRNILLAMGAYARGFDVLPRRLALQVKSETTLLARLPEREAERLAGMPSVVYELDAPPIDGIYMLPPIRYPGGHFYIKIGCNTQADSYLSTAGEMNHWVRAGESDMAKSAIIDALRAIIPGLDASSFETKRCLITYTPSVWPYIDRVDERIFVATGGNGMGAKASDAIGKLAAALMVDGRWTDELDPACFRAIYEDDIAGLGWRPSGMTRPQQFGPSAPVSPGSGA
jgi:sarcosine oxidase